MFQLNSSTSSSTDQEIDSSLDVQRIALVRRNKTDFERCMPKAGILVRCTFTPRQAAGN